MLGDVVSQSLSECVRDPLSAVPANSPFTRRSRKQAGATGSMQVKPFSTNRTLYGDLGLPIKKDVVEAAGSPVQQALHDTKNNPFARTTISRKSP